MKIILTSVGTRGDMEPFLAIGELLDKKGHQVICAFPEQFRNLAEDAGLEFASLGSKFIELLDSDAGKAAMGGATGFKKVTGTLQLAFRQGDANKELVARQQEIIDREEPDRVVYNGKAVYPILWELKHKGKTIFVSPLPYMHYVKGHTHVAFNSNYGEPLNRGTFALARFGLITTVNIARKWLKLKDKPSRKAVRDILMYNKSIYTISPSLFARPDYWHPNLQVLGYHERQNSTDWQPDPTLEAFLGQHDKILFISFGSMINPEPEKKTRIFLDLLEKHQIPAIFNVASGGLVRPGAFNQDLFYFVSQIPYNYLFPKVYAVIHHGGSGTTHLGLKNGCPTMIIPHIIDQFVWNGIVHKKGVGPKGVSINKITLQKLEPLLLDLMTNPVYKNNAEQVKQQMEQEDFTDELHQAIIN